MTSSQTAKQPDKVTSYGEVEIEYSRNHFYINNNAKFDIRRSVLFGRMHDFDFSSERNFNSQSAVMIFIGTCCKKYATDHRDFPDRADMLAIFNAINANDSHTFTDHACTLFEPLLKWVGDRSEDIEAMTVFAGLEALAESDDAHFSLLGVLLATLNGTRLDSTYKNLWMMAALHSKFEAWIKDYAGVYLTGDSPFKGRQVDW